MPPLSIESLERSQFLARNPTVRQFGPIVAVNAANTSIVEVSYLGRDRGAVQIYTSDGSAFTATFKVQGSLLPSSNYVDPVSKAVSMTPGSTDFDYFDLATVSAAGITQLPTAAAFSRIRVICTAYTAGNPRVRIL